MKKSVSLILVLASLLSLCLLCFSGCGSVNKSEVSILWSGSGKVESPNSLINSMERAMYIENVSYVHYGAEGSLSKQLEQAIAVLDKGCQVLVVELVSENGLDFAGSQIVAQQIVEAAKAKDTPVIFFNCTVDKNIVESYDKCVSVTSDDDTAADVQGELIADYVKANFKDIDKNEDNKIKVLAYGLSAEFAGESVANANAILATDDYKVSRHFLSAIGVGKDINITLEMSADLFDSEKLTDYELIITADDASACVALLELQANDYNTDKLATQFVPIVTVGESVDYKSLVLSGRPEIPADLVIDDGDTKKEIKKKNKEIKKLGDLMKYYEENKNLVDLTAVNESDIDEMIYTTINVIDSGRIAGTAIEDRDAIAGAVAKIVRNLAKGSDTFAKVASEAKKDEEPSVVVDGRFVKVRYIAYGV